MVSRQAVGPVGTRRRLTAMLRKPNAPAAERNSAAILDVLQTEFAEVSDVLEIGSGTGQHAVVFGAALSHLTWQTGDLDENHDGIRAWLADAGLTNVYEPLSLDVSKFEIGDFRCDAVYSANTAHIMSYGAVEKMFALVATALREGGRFCLYGPFRQSGLFSTASNAEFHKSLQAQNAEMGIRDLDDLDKLAAGGGMRRERTYAMPANNLLVVWDKQ